MSNINDIEFITKLLEKKRFSCFNGDDGKDLCYIRDGFTHCVPKENVIKLIKKEGFLYLDVASILIETHQGAKEIEETKNDPPPTKEQIEDNWKKFDELWKSPEDEDQSFKNN